MLIVVPLKRPKILNPLSSVHRRVCLLMTFVNAWRESRVVKHHVNTASGGSDRLGYNLICIADRVISIRVTAQSSLSVEERSVYLKWVAHSTGQLFRNYLPARSPASARHSLFAPASLLHRFTEDCKITARTLLRSENYRMLPHNSNCMNKAKNHKFFSWIISRILKRFLQTELVGVSHLMPQYLRRDHWGKDDVSIMKCHEVRVRTFLKLFSPNKGGNAIKLLFKLTSRFYVLIFSD